MRFDEIITPDDRLDVQEATVQTSMALFFGRFVALMMRDLLDVRLGPCPRSSAPQMRTTEG